MAALRGTLHMRTAELTAAHGEAAAAAHARQAAADELRALRAELEKVTRATLLMEGMCQLKDADQLHLTKPADQPALVKCRRAQLPTALTL